MPRIATLPRGPIARGTVATAAVMGGRLLALAAQMLLVARLLRPDSFAQYVAVGALAFLIGGGTTFGTQLLVLRDVARGNGRAMLATGLGTWRRLVLPLFGLYLLACHSLGLLGAAPLMVLGVGAAELLLQPLLQLMAAVCQGRGAVPLGQAWLALPLLFRAMLFLGVLMAAPDEPMTWLGGVHLVAAAAAVVLMLRFGAVQIPPPQEWRALRGSEWVPAGSFALLGITAIAQTEVDKLLAVRLLAPGAAGLYAAASRVQSAVVLPVLAMMLSAMPRLFGKLEGDRRLVLALGAASLGYASLVGPILWLLAPCVEWLLGVSYAGVGGVLRTLLWALPAQALRLVALNVLMSKGNPGARVSVELLGVLCLAVAALLAPRVGYGFAAAVVLAEWAATLFAAGATAFQLNGRGAGSPPARGRRKENDV